MVGPYPVAPVVERLKALSQLKSVGVAADLKAAVDTAPASLPAAYVVTREDSAKPELGTGIFLQAVRTVVLVVLWVRNYSQPQTGAGAAADMDALDALVRGQLLDWTPANDFEALWFAGLENSFNAGALVRQLAFRSDYDIRI